MSKMKVLSGFVLGLSLFSRIVFAEVHHTSAQSFAALKAEIVSYQICKAESPLVVVFGLDGVLLRKGTKQERPEASAMLQWLQGEDVNALIYVSSADPDFEGTLQRLKESQLLSYFRFQGDEGHRKEFQTKLSQQLLGLAPLSVRSADPERWDELMRVSRSENVISVASAEGNVYKHKAFAPYFSPRFNQMERDGRGPRCVIFVETKPTVHQWIAQDIEEFNLFQNDHVLQVVLAPTEPLLHPSIESLKRGASVEEEVVVMPSPFTQRRMAIRAGHQHGKPVSPALLQHAAQFQSISPKAGRARSRLSTPIDHTESSSQAVEDAEEEESDL